MDYKVILNDLAEVSGKVKTWERQGYAPSIEKDSVLETLRKVYSKLSPDTPAEAGTETSAVEVYREDNGIESLMEFIRASQAKLVAETRAQLEEIKDVISKKQVVVSKTEDEVKPSEEVKPTLEPKHAEEKRDAEEGKHTEEAKPVTEIKVDIKPEMAIMGFYSLPESMRMNIIHDLFNGDTSKAEISVNKMCSLKSLDDLLIYIEEHFQWSPSNATAASLISTLAKKF